MPSIAIIGAGPAGLTLARLLQRADLPSLSLSIFEKDPSPTSRFFQGGTLDLHPLTGLAAVRAAGLWDEIHEYARYEGEEMRIVDKNGTTLVHMVDAPKIEGFEARPEIDRERLKDVLLGSVAGDVVRWGKHVKRVGVDDGTGKGWLGFADGTEEGGFDLVVGADGAWSRVRGVVSDVRPAYAGICGVGASIDSKGAEGRWEGISKMVGQGSYFTFGDGKALMAQRMGDGSLKLGTWLQREESWPADLMERAGGDEAKIKSALLAEYADWDDVLKGLLEVAHQFQPWPLYELPIGHRWDHKKGFTVIGDGAHLMTPFAGEGVNHAMKDALDLAEAIIKSVTEATPLDQAVQDFEESMFPRAKKVQQETAFNKVHMFRSDAPIGFMTAMIGQVASETGHDLNKGWLAWLPITKLATGYFWTISMIGLIRRNIREAIWTRRV